MPLSRAARICSRTSLARCGPSSPKESSEPCPTASLRTTLRLLVTSGQPGQHGTTPRESRHLSARFPSRTSPCSSRRSFTHSPGCRATTGSPSRRRRRPRPRRRSTSFSLCWSTPTGATRLRRGM
eukprot:Amastigsp_a682634_64.p3 type:complete len:125 gc:universal Amastigsp_a682634_64:132-506(+)